MSERVLRDGLGAYAVITLPVYPTDQELLRILFGKTLPADQSEIIRQLERRGFPPARSVFQRRYLPSVLDWCHRQETGAQIPRSRVRLRNAPDDGLERF